MLMLLLLLCTGKVMNATETVVASMCSYLILFGSISFH